MVLLGTRFKSLSMKFALAFRYSEPSKTEESNKQMMLRLHPTSGDKIA